MPANSGAKQLAVPKQHGLLRKLIGKQQMKLYKANKKLIVRIHQIIIGLALLSYVFLNADLKKGSLVLIGAAVMSLLIQVFIYSSRPEWYGDKVKKHPYEI